MTRHNTGKIGALLFVWVALQFGAGTESLGDNANFSYSQDRTSNPRADAFTLLHLKSIGARVHIAGSGAIWRLSLRGLGDITGTQKRDSLYIDRVFQSVGTRTELKKARHENEKIKSPWFLHQAGVYHRHDRPGILFAPKIFHWFRPDSGTIDLINLPQQAHDPRGAPKYGIINHQRIQVVDDRILKMSYRWTNQAPGSPVLDRFNFPWAAFNQDLLPHLAVLNRSGDRLTLQKSELWDDTTFRDGTTGDERFSAFGFYSSAHENRGNGITFVFPKTSDDCFYRVGHTPKDRTMVLVRLPQRAELRAGTTIDSGDFFVIFGNRSEAQQALARIAADTHPTLHSGPQPYQFILSSFDSMQRKRLLSTLPAFKMRGLELLQSNLSSFDLVGVARTFDCPNSSRLIRLQSPRRIVRPADRWLCLESPYELLDIR